MDYMDEILNLQMAGINHAMIIKYNIAFNTTYKRFLC